MNMLIILKPNLDFYKTEKNNKEVNKKINESNSNIEINEVNNRESNKFRK